MALFFRIVLDVHIAAGVVALLVFWIPLVTKKGGPTHRRAGWIYVAAAATVALTGIVSSGRLIGVGRPGPLRAGLFLAYVGFFAAESALLGIRVLRAGAHVQPSRRPLVLAPPALLVAGGIGLAVFGVAQARILFVVFAALGVLQGVAHLRLALATRQAPRDRILAHMGGMGTSCITTLTAFAVVNARRLGMHTFDVGLWVVPIAVLGVGLTLWRRSVARRLPET